MTRDSLSPKNEAGDSRRRIHDKSTWQGPNKWLGPAEKDVGIHNALWRRFPRLDPFIPGMIYRFAGYFNYHLYSRKIIYTLAEIV